MIYGSTYLFKFFTNNRNEILFDFCFHFIEGKFYKCKKKKHFHFILQKDGNGKMETGTRSSL